LAKSLADYYEKPTHAAESAVRFVFPYLRMRAGCLPEDEKMRSSQITPFKVIVAPSASDSSPVLKLQLKKNNRTIASVPGE
jgi:hypothetical protein